MQIYSLFLSSLFFTKVMIYYFTLRKIAGEDKKIMKKIARFLSFIITGICLAAFMSGCKGTSRDDDNWRGYVWKSDKSVNYMDLSGEERKDIIRKYLESQYDDIDEYEFSYPEQKSYDVFSAQSAYHSTVRLPDGTFFTVWFSAEGVGKVTDDRYFGELSDKIQETVAEIINAEYPDAKVLTYASAFNMPSKRWTVSDDMKEMLTKDEIYLGVKVFFEPGTEVSEADAEKIAGLMSFQKRGGIYLYNKEIPADLKYDDLTFFDAAVEGDFSVNKNND